MRTACLSALALASSAALPALAETPLDKARAAPIEGPAYRFDLSFDDGELKAEAQVDPSKPEGERLTLVSPTEPELSESGAKRFRTLQENTTGDKIWCNQFNDNIPDDAKLISESGEAAVYSFRPIATAEEADMAKSYKHLTGRVTVSKEKPAILAYEMFAEKPFKPMLAARVDSFNMKISCDFAPDGRTYVKQMHVDLAGSAMMQRFSQMETRVISNLVALPGTETGAGQR